MYIELVDVVACLLVALFCWFVWSAIGAREFAYRTVKQHCEQQGLQLLDEHVALRGLWLKRNRRGRLCWWRSYKFEFSSTGDERYRGLVTILGRELESIEMQPHRMPE